MTTTEDAASDSAAATAGGQPPAAQIVRSSGESEIERELRDEAERAKRPFDIRKKSPAEKLERSSKPMNPVDAVDLAVMPKGDTWPGLKCQDWAECGWQFHDGTGFAVTRLYKTLKIAVDFPVDWRDLEWNAEKRERIERDGFAYVAVMPGEALDGELLRERVDAARRRRNLIKRAPVPAGA